MIRQMAFRHWYAGDCEAQIDAFLSGFAKPEGIGAARGAVVPHAGWRYSGAVAAKTLRVLGEQDPDLLVLFSAWHRQVLDRAVAYPEGAWETPSGAVEVAGDVVSLLEKEIDDFLVVDARPHAGEHAIEVQMPMIRVLLPRARVVPILVPGDDKAVHLGAEIARLVGERDVAAIASSDLTHYGDTYGLAPRGSGEPGLLWMRENDRRVLRLLENLQAEEIVGEADHHLNACGAGALAAAASFARACGARRGHVIEHTTSHEVEGAHGEFRTAVGYAGVVFA